MKRTLLFLLGSLVMQNCNAVDIYGISEVRSQKILQRYGGALQEVEQLLQVTVDNHDKHPDKNDVAWETLRDKKTQLMNKIAKENGFLSVDLQAIFYPDEHRYYSTLEIVDSQHPERLRFLSPEMANDPFTEKRTHPYDIIEAMISYQKKALTLMMQKAILDPAPSSTLNPESAPAMPARADPSASQCPATDEDYCPTLKQ